MHHLFSRLTLVVLGCLLMVIAGCAGITAPARFYVLSSLPGSGDRARVSADENIIAIGIGPVEVAQYLDRPQIVTRVSPNELKIAEFDKWAEPLKDSFSRVLAENISSHLSKDPVAVLPWRGSTPIDYRVEVEVILLDGSLGGKASLVARWAIFGEDGRKMLVSRKSSFSEPVSGQSYEAFVSAHSRAVAGLSSELAEAMKKILPQAAKR
ncbi:MAG: membrane integrity-associated transporter subunit PqiC [Desulfobacteraceae bacterium]|nr:MAG: membrane integrity-associated transporter subunit PqiC [Desulfobacteraceae bacterium]